MSDAQDRLITDLDHAVFGNARDGLVKRMDKVEGDLYRDEKTGSPGLVSDVAEIKKMMTQFNGGWKLIGLALVVLEVLRATGVLK